MQNLYDEAREKFLTQQWDWTALTVHVIYITDGYTFDPTHVFASSIPVGARVTQAGPLVGLAGDAGRAIASPFRLDVFPAGVTLRAIALASWTGDYATSELIFYTNEMRGIPFIGVGGALLAQWDPAYSAVFRV